MKRGFLKTLTLLLSSIISFGGYSVALSSYDAYNNQNTTESIDVENKNNTDIKKNNVATLNDVVHDHDDGSWTVLSTDTTISANNYYLNSTVTRNITISSNIDVALCLNGQTLSAFSGTVITITSGSLTLYDCSSDGTGTITDGNGSTYGGGVDVRNATFTMNGGTISGNSATFGGGVFVRDATFNMNGGTISNNSATSRGGGVYTYDGTFNMNGGAITNNTADDDWGGGGIYNASGTVNLNNGEITYNQASRGSGVNNAGAFYMSGGTFAYNTTDGENDSMGLVNTGSFYMSGGYYNQHIETNGNMYFYGGYLGEIGKNYLNTSAWLRDATGTNSYIILAITEDYGDEYKEDFPYAIILESLHTTHDYTYSYEQISGDSTYHRAYCYCLDEYIDTDEHTFTVYTPNGDENHDVSCNLCEYIENTFDCSYVEKYEQIDDYSHTSYCICTNTITETCSYTYRYTQINSTYHAAYCVCNNYISDTHDNFTDWTLTTVEGYDEERSCECGYTEYRVNSSSSTDTDPGNSDNTSTTNLTTFYIIIGVILVVCLIVAILVVKKAKKDSNKENKVSKKK